MVVFKPKTSPVGAARSLRTSSNAEKCIYTCVYTSRVESFVFEVLADSTRRRIVETLGAGGRPVPALVEAGDIQQTGGSPHPRLLHQAGVVLGGGGGQERRYSVCAE